MNTETKNFQYDESFNPLKDYVCNGYDEAISDKSQIRITYKKFLKWFNNQNYSELSKKDLDANRLFKITGITFNVYGDKDDTEKLIPFDMVPRIISSVEWEKVEKGVSQRIRAINSFLNDIYHNQEIIKAKILPIELIYKNPAYLFQMVGFRPPNNIYNHISGIDLIKTKASEFYVLEDNVRVPSGISYMMKNRDIMINLFPELFAELPIRNSKLYPRNLSKFLKKSSPNSNIKSPVVAVLTPGVNNSAYFEHSYLADQMGVELVEGIDLSIRKGHLSMRTIEGWKKIDVLYRRIDDEYLDPLWFKEDSLLGVPGLMDVYRKGNITIANAPGTGIADDKAIYSYVPEMIKFYLGEQPILNNVQTFRCSHKTELKYVIENIDKLVVKEVHGSGGYGMLIGPFSSKKEIENFKRKILANPKKYIAQPTLALSTCPVFSKTGLVPRHVDLRPFALLSKDEVYVTPGGLTRVALKKGSLVVNSSQGGGTKDTWVIDK